MEKLIQLLKQEGLKATPQRIEILKLLEELGHPSVEEIYARLKGKFPSISLATIYKNLTLLREKGVVNQLHLEEGSRYELKRVSHAHKVCPKCGKVEDIPFPAACSEQLEGGEGVRFELYIYDLCPDCKE